MSVVGAIMVPHPPIILPEVGKGEERKISATDEAYRKAAAFVGSLKPETISTYHYKYNHQSGYRSPSFLFFYLYYLKIHCQEIYY